MNDEMSMSTTEIARMIDFLRAVGLDEKTINDCVKHIATGLNLPSKDDKEQ